MAKKAQSVSVIKGTDGSTSIFIAGQGYIDKNRIRRIRNFYRNWRYHKKRKKAEKRIVPEFHSLEETKQFIETKYRAKEVDASYPYYEKRRKQLKCSIIKREKQCVEGMEELSEDEFPTQYHLYLIDFGDIGQIEIEIEDNYEIMCMSAGSNSKGNLEKLHKVEKEIYLYYGVTQEDIDKHTDRYLMLVAELCF